MLALVTIGKLKNPFFDPKHGWHVHARLPRLEVALALNMLQRKRYQQNGAFGERGEAAPEGVVVIGPGWLPAVAARRCEKRTLAYMRRRAEARQRARSRAPVRRMIRS